MVVEYKAPHPFNIGNKKDTDLEEFATVLASTLLQKLLSSRRTLVRRNNGNIPCVAYEVFT
jgi:hypothetical protein